MSENFEQKSYRLHKALDDASASKIPSLLANSDLIDAWRHQRMHAFLAPMHKHFRSSKWLTIGDGGADAAYLHSQGVTDITCSSISTARLNQIKSQGYLQDIPICELNAEALQLPDNSVDIIFCKEAYHHFPRPHLAFYEFLRVAKTAIIFIEPCEEKHSRLLSGLKVFIKKILRSKPASHQVFEPAGNFLFRLSEREVIKMSTAMQLPCVAFMHFNDFWVRSIAARKQSDKLAMTTEKIGVAVQDILCSLKLLSPGLIVLIAFKTSVDKDVIDELSRSGYQTVWLPRNPYLAE